MAAMVDDLGMAAAVVLAATFAWAGAAKLSRPDDTASGFAGLGLGGAAALAMVVPAVELVLAVALLAAPAVGGAVALVLLAAFSVVLLRAVRRGVEVRCACFGQAGGPPLSPVDLLRNGLLAGLAALATAAGPTPRVPAPAAVAAVAAAVVAGAGLLRALRRRRSRDGAAGGGKGWTHG